MSDELEFDMPEDELFDELLIESSRFFHGLVNYYRRSTSSMYPESQAMDSSVNVASLALLGVLRMYDLGGAVICEDVSRHASGRAADAMIHRAGARTKQLLGSLVDPDSSDTLH